MSSYVRESRPWLVWTTIIAVIFVAVGILFYYTFFRQSKSELIESVPTDAAFVMVINDNDALKTGAKDLSQYFNELFVLDALPAFNTITSNLSKVENIIISGHFSGENIGVLFNVRSDKASFNKLLRALSIDPNNFTSFESNKIYTFGANFKSMKFAYVNHIILFSADAELLKRAIIQQKHPKNLLSNKDFKEIYQLTDKNRKQNWLIVEQKSYFNYLNSYLQSNSAKKIAKLAEKVGWAAYQLRFGRNEIFFSGYGLAASNKFTFVENNVGNGCEIANLIPSQVCSYSHFEISDYKQFAKKISGAAAKFVNETKLSEICIFNIPTDSTIHKFIAILPDTSANLTDILLKNVEDSEQTQPTDGIFSANENATKFIGEICNDSAAYVLENNGLLIFANSTDELLLYKKLSKNGTTLSQNRFYKFSSESIASSSVANFALFDNLNSNFRTKLLSEKGSNSAIGRNLQIISLSCNNKEDRFIPINIYLNFKPKS